MTEVTKMENTGMAAQGNDPMLEMMERVLLSPDVPMDRITAIMDLRERQLNKEAEQAFNEAFASAMAEMPDVPRSGLNRHTGQKYPTLDDLIRTARPVLARHGLSMNWQTGISGDKIWVRAIVRHALGHSIETTDEDDRDTGKAMNRLQGGGSTQTYLKRYTGFAILGLSSGDEVDDDGRGASATITEDQFNVLRDMLEKACADEKKMLAYFKIEMLEALPLSKYGEAEAMLRAKLKKGGA